MIEIEENINKRLDIYFCEYFKGKFTRQKILLLIKEGKILVNDKIQKPSYKLKLKDRITFFDIDNLNDLPIIKPLDYKLDIIFEDDDLIVINKPKNMLTHPTKYDSENTLVNALIHHCGIENLSDLSGLNRPGIVHRLDKNTSGLMMAAKNNFAHKNLANQIRKKEARRKYLAIALGEFEKKEGIINKSLLHYMKNNVKMVVSSDNKGLEAITHYRVIEEFVGAALVELELKTGRTHQIRAHLASISHPIFGDTLYGARGFLKNEFKNLKTDEQLLESCYLSFFHPRSNKLMEFYLKEEFFSEDFIKVLKFLRSRKNEY